MGSDTLLETQVLQARVGPLFCSRFADVLQNVCTLIWRTQRNILYDAMD